MRKSYESAESKTIEINLNYTKLPTCKHKLKEIPPYLDVPFQKNKKYSPIEVWKIFNKIKMSYDKDIVKCLQHPVSIELINTKHNNLPLVPVTIRTLQRLTYKLKKEIRDEWNSKVRD